MVAALTETTAPPSAADIAASISARRGPIFGRGATTCTATLPIANPAPSSMPATCASICAPLAPAISGRPVPKTLPRSPSPAAESRALQAAWAATSPSL